MTATIAGWLPAADAAKTLGRSRRSLDALRIAGKVKAHPIRTPSGSVHAWRYDPESLRAYLDREATQDRAARGWVA